MALYVGRNLSPIRGFDSGLVCLKGYIVDKLFIDIESTWISAILNYLKDKATGLSASQLDMSGKLIFNLS